MRLVVIAFVLVVGGCAQRSLKANAAVNFDVCKPCHAPPMALSVVFDTTAPELYRDKVRKVLNEDHHPYRPSTDEWSALMTWTDG